MKKAEFVKLVSQDTGITQKDVAVVMDSIFKNIIAVLADDEDKITISSFGSFTFKDRAARVGRNPVTGDKVPIPAKRALVFKMSESLSDLLNE